MKFLRILILPILSTVVFCVTIYASPVSGFFLPDSVKEMTLHYRTIKNLIILPVVINDTIKLNLILDTGCRNVVLFGKRFKKLLKLTTGRPVQFSGLGAGGPVFGSLSLNNRVEIGSVLGENIPVVTVSEKNLFDRFTNVHGIIGYDIFLKFEIEINPAERKITFRPAEQGREPFGYERVPLKIVETRPMIDSRMKSQGQNDELFQLMIDTGSSLGLLLKTTEIERFESAASEFEILGQGLNGPISGFRTFADELHLAEFVMDGVPANITASPWHNYASLGMDVLKDYVVVINYVKMYACFRKLDRV